MTAASTSPLATERSAPALTKNQIRGAGLRTLLRVLEDQESSADFQRIVAQLPDEVRQLAETRLIAAAHWFPLQWYAAVHEAADRVCRRGPRYARRLGYLGAERDLKSIYRLFLKVAQPKAFLRVVPLFFSKYVAVGSMQVTFEERRCADAVFSSCSGFSHYVWQDVVGHGEAGMTLAGGRNVRMHIVEGGGDGDTSMVLRAYWN